MSVEISLIRDEIKLGELLQTVLLHALELLEETVYQVVLAVGKIHLQGL